MRHLIINSLFLVIFVLFPTNHQAQIFPVEFFYDLESQVEDNLEQKVKTTKLNVLPIRMNSNQEVNRIHIESQVTLKDVTVNVSDLEGNAYITYNFPVLSDLEMSLKRVPEGDFVVMVSSKIGTASRKFVR